ncbi:MAG TPA: immunoglobulin-like domain-containing protein [Bacteroidia bacterium]|nr:immunoglobulin-like domain-containing protein [Bacteroidia bacterium]
MKTIQIISAAACTALFFSGCNKDDATPPQLTMNGEKVITIYLNAPFNDPGVTASDNEDGNINVTSDVSATNPDVNKVGTYYIHYSVTDGAGNKSETMRTVLVKNSAETLSDSYAVTGTCNSGFTDGIIISTTTNNRITFTGFGWYTNAAGKLSADIDFITSTVTIVPASFVCGTNPVNRSFSGGGALSFGRDTVWINTVETTATGSVNCTYIYVRQ